MRALVHLSLFLSLSSEREREKERCVLRVSAHSTYIYIYVWSVEVPLHAHLAYTHTHTHTCVCACVSYMCVIHAKHQITKRLNVCVRVCYFAHIRAKQHIHTCTYALYIDASLYIEMI
jgi:hypothetical protein